MDYFNQPAPIHFGNVNIATLGPRKLGANFSPIEYKLTYINNLPIDVVVEWRSGLKFTLKSQRSMACNKLIARVEIVIHQSIKNDIQSLLSAVDENSSLELRAMRDAFNLQVEKNLYGGVTLILDYPLTLSELKEYGGSIYYNELDCVISLLEFNKTPPHPNSEEGKRKQIITGSVVDRNGKTFGYSVQIIDNHNRHGPRYLNIGNDVYKVNNEKDNNKRDGIYIVSNSSIGGELGMSGIDVRRYPFDGAEEKLGLYRTYDEALNLGDTANARKQANNELEHRITLQKGELQKAKHEHDLAMIAKDAEVKAMQIEQDRQAQAIMAMREKAEQEMNAERARVKDHYENKSHVRKDTSESVKYLPSIVIGLGAFFLAIRTILS